MKYWVSTGGGSYAQPFSQKENAETEAKELSLSEEDTWFEVVDDLGNIISGWRDGQGYYPPETEREVDDYLRENGYDPEQVGKDIAEFVHQLIEGARQRNKFGKPGPGMFDI